MISVEHLTKCYGDFLAVDDLTFEITEGHVYGFLGPNGAGKSTTMNIMTGCLSATEGHVKIDGHDIFDEPEKAKRLIGYLPEHPPLYMNETPVQYLTFVGEAKGLRGKELKQQINYVIEQTKIEDVKHKKISELSKGYKQRVGIAQALIGNPKVIILDEPTVGLDPIQIIEIRTLIKELGQTHTVIFSSHILSEVQTICDRILIIARGKLIAFDEPEKLEKQLLSPNEIILTAEADESDVREILSNLEHISEMDIQVKEPTGYVVVNLKTKHEDIYEVSRAIYTAFMQRKIILLEMSLKKVTLEDVFIELTEDKETEISIEESGIETSESPDDKGEVLDSNTVSEHTNKTDNIIEESGVDE